MVQNINISNLEKAKLFFEKIDLNTFKCLICSEIRKQNPSKGYSNLCNHINDKHLNWPTLLNDMYSLKNNTLDTMIYSEKIKNVYGWIDLIIGKGNLLFSTCEDKNILKYCTLKKIDVATLLKYSNLLVELVEEKIENILLKNFGIMFDQWSDSGNRYIGLFACFQGKKHILLAFSPLLNEDDLSATSHKEYLEYILKIYKRKRENILFITGDNCPLMKAIANILNVPLVGCASHRFNLAAEKFINENFNEEISILAKLMSKLNALKQRAKLRLRTDLSPVLYNDTRWMSKYKMVERYIQLKEYIDTNDNELIQFLPTPIQISKIIKSQSC